MIQDPRMGYTQIPLHLPGKSVDIPRSGYTQIPLPPPWEKWGGASSDLFRKCAFCPVIIPGRHPGPGQRD